MVEVAGVCLVQNSIDTVPLLCGHYLRLGFTRLVFLDDKSTDGTFEFLQALGRADPRVTVRSVDLRHVHAQGELMTEAANGLIAQGVNLIFPFDADEFWNLDLKAVQAFAKPHKHCIFVGQMLQVIQSEKVERSTPLSLLRAVHRAPVLFDGAMKSVKHAGSYVCFSKNKVGFKARAPVKLWNGNHGVELKSPWVECRGLEVFHLILRSPEEIDVRAARSVFDIPYWRDGLTPEGRRALWKANSAGANGCLNTDMGPIVLVRDRRLRSLLTRAIVYMASRHPLLFFRAAQAAAKPRDRRAWGARAPTAGLSAEEAQAA